MRSSTDVAAIRVLAEQGLNDCEIARRTGIPRTTVRDIRRPRYETTTEWTSCPSCWKRARMVFLTAPEYAELLGWYLGDGHIGTLGRSLQLRISVDAMYVTTNAELVALLRRCFHDSSVTVWRVPGRRLDVIRVINSHLACLFPQHGPGKKHERDITIRDWQRVYVDAAPFSLLRGLLHSDGCCFVNRTGRYEYISYDFSNRSQDILDLFCETCDRVGVRHRRYAEHVRVYRRASVEILLEHVGAKS